MANFTALKTAINNAIKTNGNEEITGAILQAILDAMVETLGDSAINDLENAITTEVTNRENAVGDVAADLAAEALARQALDYNVNNRINAEEYNRQNADAALSQTMSQGFQTLGSQMTALNAAISALNAAYQNGYLYGGIATPSSSPSNGKCFYIALQGGIYTNFGGVGVVEGINIIKNDSGWKVEHIYDQTTLLNEFYLLRQQVIQAITSFAPIVIEGDVTNAPDEEDLTSNANHLLQFKNNAYSPLEFSGLGRKYLRKNIAPLSESAPFNGFVEGVTAEETLSGTPTQIFWDRMNTRFVGIKDGVYYLDWTGSDNYVPVSTSLVYMYNGTPYQWTGSDFIVDETEVPNLVNCLTQDMINEANTIYIIRYDYTLKENITIPANCVLQFDGGSISAGSGENMNTITGDNTGIQTGLVKIFNTDIITKGTWILSSIYVEWFQQSNNDSSDALQKAIDLSECAKAPVSLVNNYTITKSIIVPWGGITLQSVREENKTIINKTFNGYLFKSGGTISKFLQMKGITIHFNETTGGLIETSSTTKITPLLIDDCKFLRCSDVAINLKSSYYGEIKNCLFDNCSTGIEHSTATNVIKIDNCSFFQCGIGVKYNNENYTNKILNCSFQGCQAAIIAIGCFGLTISSCYFEYNGNAENSIIAIKAGQCITVTGCTFTGHSEEKSVIEIDRTPNTVFLINNYIAASMHSDEHPAINIVSGEGIVLSKAEAKKYGGSSKYVLSLNHVDNAHPEYFTGNYNGEPMYCSLSSVSSNVYWNQNSWVKQGFDIGFKVAASGATRPDPSVATNYQGIYRGFPFFDTTINKPIFAKNITSAGVVTWVESDGAKAGVNRSGTFAEKPSASDIYVGFRYFCTDKQTTEGATDGIDIIYKGNNVWVDALGRVVS